LSLPALAPLHLRCVSVFARIARPSPSIVALGVIVAVFPILLTPHVWVLSAGGLQMHEVTKGDGVPE
jgi:hypothetical protein